MSNRDSKFVLSAEDRTQAALKSAESGFKQLSEQLKGMREMLVGAFAFDKLVDLGRELVNTNIEMQRIHFTLEAATGSSKSANREFAFVASTANKLGLDLVTTASAYARLAASAHAANVPVSQQHALFTALARASTVLHLSTENTNSAMLALEQMMSKGKVQTQELQLQLGTAIPAVLAHFKKELHVTGTELNSLLQNGQLATKTVLPALINALNDVAPESALQGAVKGTNAEIHRMQSSLEMLRASLSSGGFINAVTTAAQALSEVAKAFTSVDAKGKDTEQTLVGLGTVIREGVGGPLAFVRMGFQYLGNAIGMAAAQFGEFFRSVSHADFKGLGGRLAAIGRAADEDNRRVLQQYMDTLQKLEHPQNVGGVLTAPKRYDTSGIYKELTAAGISQTKLTQIARNAANAEKARKTSIEDIIKALHQQAATYGKTSEQVDLYRLKIEGATAAQLAEAKAAIERINNHKAIAREQQAKTAIEKAATAAEQQHNQQLYQASERLKDTLDPTRQYRRELEQLREEERLGYIDAAQYAEGIKRIDKQMKQTSDQAHKTTDSINQFAVQSARSIEGVISNTLQNGFKNGFKGISDEVGAALQKIAAEIVAADLGKKLFGNMGGSASGGSGGGSWGWVGDLANIASHYFHDGGVVGRDGRVGNVSALAFLNAPRFHNGGFPGLASDEVPAVLQTGERVLSRREVAQGAGAGHITLIQNIQTPDLRSFNQAKGQVASDMAAEIDRANRRYR